MRSPLGVVAPRLQEVFRDLGFDSAGVEEYLGNATMAALRRPRQWRRRCDPDCPSR